MAASHEAKLIATYIRNLMARTSRRAAVADTLVTWLCDLGHQIDCHLEIEDGGEETVVRERQKRGKPQPRKIVSAENWQAAQNAVEKVCRQKPKPLAFDRNIGLLTTRFGLGNIERDILDLACRYARHSPFESLWDDIFIGFPGGGPVLIAHLLGHSPQQITGRLALNGRLQRLGLVSTDHYDTCRPAHLADGVVDALSPPSRSFDDICSRLIGPIAKPNCAWSNFDHLGEARDMVLRLVRGALKRRAKGVNILFYGPPGTGKTEFCKVLAAEAGAILHAVAETDERGREPNRWERVARLRLSQQILTNRGDAIALFDEMEDVLDTGKGGLLAMLSKRPGAGSKIYLNRLLEETPVPTFWTTNSVDGFDPALMRRMTLAIEIRTPSQSVRERVWKESLEREKLPVETTLSSQLAHEFVLAPALAVSAINATKLSGGKDKDLRLAIRSVAKAMNGGKSPAPVSRQDAAFALELANADQRLDVLSERLSHLGENKAVSLCLFGPPGTGKSAFVRHLAQRMDMPVVQKRASDLISMWLGESEANIAAAFEEARADGAFLIFDEADSLLSDRAGAQRSWEVSQVNEMLTWMESHELPFACTTNLMDRLDPASLRRFTFKIRFGFLDRKQVMRAFENFFGLPAPAKVAEMDILTPGDFAVVRRKADLLGFADDPVALANALAEEMSIKPQTSKKIGFQMVG